MSQALSIPYPPSANRLWRNTPKGTLKSAAYRTWINEARVMLAGQRFTRVCGAYRLTVVATRPDNRRRDLGNLLKATEDCLVDAGVIEDDHKAQSILLMWSGSPPVRGGALTVTVAPAGAEA